MRDEMRSWPDRLRLALCLSGERLQIAVLLGGSEAARDKEVPSNYWALVTRPQHPSRISSSIKSHQFRTVGQRKRTTLVVCMKSIDGSFFRPFPALISPDGRHPSSLQALYRCTLFCFASSAIVHDPAQHMQEQRVSKQEAHQLWNGTNNVTRHAHSLVRTSGTLASRRCSMLLMVRVAL